MSLMQQRLAHWSGVFASHGTYNGLRVLKNAILAKAYLRSEGRMHPGQIRPTNLAVGVTSVCNLRCPACLHGNRAHGADFVKPRPAFMNLDQFKAIADDALLYAYDLNLTGAGESFLNPDIYDIIAYAKRQKTYVYLDSNGHNIDADKVLDCGLDKVTYSLDGFSQASYEKYRRGGNFEQVLNSITELSKKAAKRSSSLSIRVKFLVNAYNEHEMETIREYFQNMSNVELYFDYFWIPPEEGKFILADDYTATPEMYGKWAPKHEQKFNIYRFDEDNGIYKHISMDLPFKKMCAQAYIGMYINVTGDAFPCCKAALPEIEALYLGNVFTEGVTAVFNGEKSKKFRSRFTATGGRFSICTECWGNKAITQDEICQDAADALGQEGQ